MGDNYKDKERVLWIDIYKAISIIFIVLGHITSRWGGYVYQFHIAAFFFISGYTANLRKRSIARTIWDKIYTLMVPLFSVSVLVILGVSCLEKFGIYKYFTTSEFVGIYTNIKNLFLNGNCNIEWLGATWFIIVLFGIFILHKIIDQLCNNNLLYNSIIFTILFFIGYLFVWRGITGQLGMFSIDLILIGQFFFGLGRIFKEGDIFKKIFFKKSLFFIIFIINIVFFYVFKNKIPAYIDYPSRMLRTPCLIFVASLNGIFFTYLLSLLLSKIKYIKELFAFIGRNTLGIVFFHFIFFKGAYFILYLLGEVPFVYLQQFTPSEEIGQSWWPLILIISIALSVGMWSIIKKIKYFNVLFGENKILANQLYDTVDNKIKPYFKLIKAYKVKTVVQQNLNKQIINLNKNRIKVLFIFVLVVLIITPLWTQGIMCNDELQARFWSMQGFKEFNKHYWNAGFEQGRTFQGILMAFFMYFGFIGESNVIFRIIPILSILIVTCLFGYLIRKIFNNVYFGIFCALVSLAFLPITFENTSPNAFSALFNIPFALLIISFIIYLKYLKSDNKKYLLISMLLFFFICMSYEAFITYTLFYICLYIGKYGIGNKKRFIRESFYPIFTGILFLALYLANRMIFGTSYEGNQIGGFTVFSIFSILKQLFLVSLPGYFLANSKYHYLVSIYKDGIQLIDYIRVFLVVILTSIVFYHLLNKNKSKSDYSKNSIFAIGVGLLYCIIPALPISISKMYQGNVAPDHGFAALPTTFFTYFSAIFVCCYIIWGIVKRCNEKSITTIIILFIGINLFQVQVMNSTIAIEQNKNFKALCQIEDFFKTDFIHSKMQNSIFYSPDVYKTRQALAIHDGYWSFFTQAEGINLKVEEELYDQKIFNSGEFNLYFIEDENFVITNNKTAIVASKNQIQGTQYVSCEGLWSKSGEFDTIGNNDNGFYFYYFAVTEDNLIAIPEEKIVQ